MCVSVCTDIIYTVDSTGGDVFQQLSNKNLLSLYMSAYVYMYSVSTNKDILTLSISSNFLSIVSYYYYI